MAVVLLAACAPAAAQTLPVPQDPQPAVDGEKVVVTWLARLNEAENRWETEVVIPDFERRNPNIKINLVIVPEVEFDEKLQAMVDASTPPDVWSHWGAAGFQEYLRRGMVADLTPFVQQDRFDLSDFQEEALNAYTLDGRIMGLPISITSSFVFYNKDLFDKAGVEYPPTFWDNTTWTWEAFLEKCKELTSVTGDPRTDIFGCSLAAWPNDQYPWLWGQDIFPDTAYQTGFAETAYLDHPVVIEAFQARRDLIWKLHYMPDPVQADAFGGGDLFQAQKVAMQISGGQVWKDLRDETGFRWGAAALPYGSPGRKAVLFTDPWLLSSQSEHPEEAWTFLKYLVSSDVQESFMELSGATPVRKSLAAKWYAKFPSMDPPEVKEVHLGALRYGKESPSHLLVRFNALDQIISSALEPVINNEKLPGETLPAANDRLIETLKQIQKAFE